MEITVEQKIKNTTEFIMKLLFMACAVSAVLALFTIIFFIFSRGVPAIWQIGIIPFLTGTQWQPSVYYQVQHLVADGSLDSAYLSEFFGIFSFIVASAITTFFAFLVGSRVGLWCAIYLSMFCPKRIYRPLKTMVELLGGIPSVLYGFFGVVVVVPFIRAHLGGPGNSILAAIIILSVMILPTVINLSEAAIRAVPNIYYEGALALGNTKTEAVFDVVVPAAKSGINASYILGVGRAIGETMAVIMVIGNAPVIPGFITDAFPFLAPGGFLDGARSLTAAIALEMSYASGLHQDLLFGIGVVLFTIVISLNLALTVINRRNNG